MSIERVTGTLFTAAVLLFTLFYLLSPQPKYTKPFVMTIPDIEQPVFDTALIAEPVQDIDVSYEALEAPKDMGKKAAQVQMSDFNLFVVRVSVFSSFDNASKLVLKINQGGYPAFVEPLETNAELHAVYVGPFISEDEINNNIISINKITETEAGAIMLWKPSV
ncbi:SPOR domain-containing protein [Gammaproteobacteria bacterium]|nr:SPOR domain-containing protein [Gammaproteobacteria bacterium]